MQIYTVDNEQIINTRVKVAAVRSNYEELSSMPFPGYSSYKSFYFIRKCVSMYNVTLQISLFYFSSVLLALQ